MRALVVALLCAAMLLLPAPSAGAAPITSPGCEVTYTTAGFPPPKALRAALRAITRVSGLRFVFVPSGAQVTYQRAGTAHPDGRAADALAQTGLVTTIARRIGGVR